MEVILLEHVDKLGKMGDKVTVKNGYARNYLLPHNKALRATEANVAYFEKQKAELEAHNKALFDTASAKAEALKGFKAVLIRQAAETGQLYGSVTIRDIAAAIKEAGHDIERRLVYLEKVPKVFYCSFLYYIYHHYLLLIYFFLIFLDLGNKMILLLALLILFYLMSFYLEMILSREYLDFLDFLE